CFARLRYEFAMYTMRGRAGGAARPGARGGRSTSMRISLTSPLPEGRGFSALAGQGSCFTDGCLPALRAGWSHTISAGEHGQPGRSYIHSRVDVPVVEHAAVGARPLPDV